MSLLLPAGLAALLLSVPILVLHILSPRRLTTKVSSLIHWDGLKHAITAAEPWQRLRWSLLLALQLTAVALFALALARPAVLEEAGLAEHTIFIVDASGSMAAIDETPDRLGAAIAEAKRLRNELPDEGVASLIAASPRPSVLATHSDDLDEFSRAADTIRTMAGGADFETAFALAESLVIPDRETDVILLSDGRLDEAEQRLAPLGTRFVSVGQTDTNRAVTDLSVTSAPDGMRARVTITSTGGADATQVLRLDVDGATAHSEELTIPGGGVVEETFELPAGSRVAAFLDGEDLLAYDNQRFAVAPTPASLQVRVHGEGRFFIDQLLAAIPEVGFDVGPGEEADFEVYAGVPLPAEPEVPFIAMDTPGGAPGILPVGRVENPVPTLVADDPLLSDVDASQIAIAEAQRLDVSEGDILLAAPGAPLMVAGETRGIPFYYIAFTLEQSNLPIDIAYPIIGTRMVADLTTADGTSESITVGDRLPLGSGGGSVTDPRGNTTLVSVGDSEPIADVAGFWTISRQGDEPFTSAVNPDSGESDLAPRSELADIRPAPGSDPMVGATTTMARTLIPWVLGALLFVLAVELLVSYRSRGVPPRQWRVGLALRAALVALVVLALVDPPFSTRSGEVTTVFVVDVSDSVRESGRESARAWVESAVASADSNEWAVVEFGSDARVGTPFGGDVYRRAPGVGAEATSLARGLRLGESLLSGETRERIVLVSDGRGNSGDLQAELERLRTLGVVVDVHTISPAPVTDAAVSAIDLPAAVNSGESFEVDVEVLSTVSGTATVELSHGPDTVDTVEAQLSPGPNHLSFSAEATETGTQQFTATVRMTGDAVPENDTHHAAVQVGGEASVMIIEGEDGNGRVLADALTARGLAVERVGIADMPSVQGLSAHRAVILVDVGAREMSDARVDTLGTFVRDLGRGLVVLGGTRSYGPGGYRDTPLEALLPLDAEPPDPEQDVNIAEVLLIDTSESMGACHCAEGTLLSTEGGVNKTDISRLAARRAIDALSVDDEVGVLAFSGSPEWMIPLQPKPDEATIERGIGALHPEGGTRIVPALYEAAEHLLASDKELRHIILLTDGFTTELESSADFVGVPLGDNLVDAVGDLAEMGITVSIVGTGEGANQALEGLAQVGNGRFYPGRDLEEIPEIFVQETRLASRSLISEGEFFPVVTSSAEAVRTIAASPAILGYIATSPKATADVHLRVGALGDPLLASWRVGLGKVTAWTSDGGDRWAADWAGWDGFEDFWSTVVRDTFPLGGAEGQRIDASIANDVMIVSLESAQEWPAQPVARVSYPDGTSEELELDRISDFEFGAVVPATQEGTYAVGASVPDGTGDASVLSTLATSSFAAEYLPGDPDTDLMSSISAATGGRGHIDAGQAFDAEGLAEGVIARHFGWWFLLAAALLWPVDVALRRLRLSRREPTDRPGRSSLRQPRPTTPAASRKR